jgi:glycosyltransferase involved in cell wall biosynthesis
MSLVGDWPKCNWSTGLIQDKEGGLPTSAIAAFENYKVIVLQQPRTAGWLGLIHKLREAGKIVIYECDDYLHGIAEKKDHDYRKWFTHKYLVEYERAMRACDAMIVSTDFIAEQYSRFNHNIHVCRNGLDVARYNLTLPERPTINIGWAGATGHQDAMMPWLQTIANVMGEFENTCFVSIGQAFANSFIPAFGDRALSIPFASIEQYPGAMTMFDIALAPTAKGGWYKGKSDLRFLEAGALGVPLVTGSKEVYPEIEHGVNGILTSSPEAMGLHLSNLIRSPELRKSMGAAAREHVRTKRSIKVMAEQWRVALNEIVEAGQTSDARSTIVRDHGD